MTLRWCAWQEGGGDRRRGQAKSQLVTALGSLKVGFGRSACCARSVWRFAAVKTERSASCFSELSVECFSY